MGFSGGSDGNQSACNARDLASIPGLGRSPGGGRYGNPLQYSCLKNPHGQRSLTGYSPGGCKQSDTTEQLSRSTQRAKSSASSFLFGSSYPYLKKEKKKKKKTYSWASRYPKFQNKENKNKCLISNSNHMNQKLQEWVGLRNVDCNILSLQRDGHAPPIVTTSHHHSTSGSYTNCTHNPSRKN